MSQAGPPPAAPVPPPVPPVPPPGPAVGPARPGPLTWEDRRWHYRRSLASRVTLLTTMAVGLTVALVALSAFMTVRMQLQSTLDSSLLNRANKAVQTDGLREAVTRGIPPAVFGAADVRIVFINSDRAFATSGYFPSMTLGQPELDVARGATGDSIRTIVSADGERYRVATVRSGDNEALVLAQPLAAQEETLARLALVMTIFGLLGVAIAGLAGWAVARNGLRPVRRLTTDVERIARTEDFAPLRVEGDDEVARLATAFNQMLAALSASRDRQRQLVADAGHELRTPITSLRTNLDLLAQAGDGLPAEARQELLGDVRAQIEEMTTLVGDLMELSRDEQASQGVERLDLAEVVDRALARVRRRAPGIAFDTDLRPWWLLGDAAALERAVTNLLDNAAKWSPDAGTVTTRLAEGVLVVDDQGPGIGEADLPHVFERFYRADESRSMPGSGLGLAIVRQVAERHGGWVVAGAAPGGGARLTMSIPGRALEQAPALTAEAATGTLAAGGRPSTASRRTPRQGPTAP